MTIDIRSASLIFILLGSALGLGACSSGGDSQTVSNSELFAEEPDRSAGFFDPQRVMDVQIELEQDDYERLRYEGRTLGDLLGGCGQPGFLYDHYKATVSIDGEQIDNVDIRKKGFLGSLSPSRPSFKLNFDEFQAGRKFESMTRMTLNNNRQDGSATHQCVTYQLFRNAGLPAPRCNFARVTVNGTSLGYYSNVESINEQFVQRNFTTVGGNLYEAQLGGFADGRKSAFQLKNNSAVNDRSDLDAVVNALEADDDNLLSLLEQVVDLEHFLNFWAMEIITGHWDGASGNLNNYFIYRNPEDGRFSYIPWGTDGALSLPGLAGVNSPLFHFSFLSNRLYQVPEFRQRLFDKIEERLNSNYDVAGIFAEMDRIAIVADGFPAAVQITKDFVENQPDLLRDAMQDQPLFIAPAPIDGTAEECSEERVQITGSFDGASGSFTYTDSAGELRNLNGFVQLGDLTGGGILGQTNPQSVSFNIIGLDDGAPVVAIFSVEAPEFKPGLAPLHGVATTIFLFETGAGGGFAIGSTGSFSFTEADLEGGPLSGSFEAELVFSNGFLPGGG